MSAILSGEKMIITWGEIDWGENYRDSPLNFLVFVVSYGHKKTWLWPTTAMLWSLVITNYHNLGL